MDNREEKDNEVKHIMNRNIRLLKKLYSTIKAQENWTEQSLKEAMKDEELEEQLGDKHDVYKKMVEKKDEYNQAQHG